MKSLQNPLDRRDPTPSTRPHPQAGQGPCLPQSNLWQSKDQKASAHQTPHPTPSLLLQEVPRAIKPKDKELTYRLCTPQMFGLC